MTISLETRFLLSYWESSPLAMSVARAQSTIDDVHINHAPNVN
jgi:hypothetical protein